MNLAHDDLGPRDGRPVLLVHGHPFDRSLWRPQAEYLAERGHRVVTPDLRGYGDSKISGTTATKTGLDVFANDLVELADHLGLDRFVLGGLSMGGQIVMQLVEDHPDRVEALLLADTFAGLDTPEAKQARIDTAARILEEGMAGYADELLPKMISKRTRATRPDVEAHVRRMMRDAPAGGAAARAARTCRAPRLHADAHPYRSPHPGRRRQRGRVHPRRRRRAHPPGGGGFDPGGDRRRGPPA